MGKRLIIVLALALLLGATGAAYAEVQNIKVSGDITAAGVLRSNFELTKDPYDNGGSRYEKDWFSIVRLRVDADLTDNVSATVRLLNERNWNGSSIADGANNNVNIGYPTGNVETHNENIDLDLAYVTMKEFLYSPLSLKIGRQELHIGNDWLMGDPDTNIWSGKTSLAEGDLSARKAFDAIRATLDYNPLVVDMFFAKVEENDVTKNDDTNLYGVNAAYTLDKNTTLEGFFFSKVQNVKAAEATHVDTYGSDWTANVKDKADTTYAVGGRIVNKTVKNLTVDAQAAFQFGTYNPRFDPNARGGGGRLQSADCGNRRAWGLEAMLDYDLKDIKMISKYAPSISAVYIYLSGASRNRVGTEDYNGWNPMFENQTFGHIANAILSFTNQSIFGMSAKAKPFQDVGLKLDYLGFWANKEYPQDSAYDASGVSLARQYLMNHKSFLGQECDLTLTYDYTEDVQFSLLGGVFMPGSAFSKDVVEKPTAASGRATATELIGSMKVTF